jgi:hypothetical protein
MLFGLIEGQKYSLFYVSSVQVIDYELIIIQGDISLRKLRFDMTCGLLVTTL